MLTAAGGDNVFADTKREAVQATTELIIARAPEVILELRADPMDRQPKRRRSARLELAGVGAGGSQPAACTSSTIRERSFLARGSPTASRCWRARCTRS